MQGYLLCVTMFIGRVAVSQERTIVPHCYSSKIHLVIGSLNKTKCIYHKLLSFYFKQYMPSICQWLYTRSSFYIFDKIPQTTFA